MLSLRSHRADKKQFLDAFGAAVCFAEEPSIHVVFPPWSARPRDPSQGTELYREMNALSGRD
jgi:hypothetical protein